MTAHHPAATQPTDPPAAPDTSTTTDPTAVPEPPVGEVVPTGLAADADSAGGADADPTGPAADRPVGRPRHAAINRVWSERASGGIPLVAVHRGMGHATIAENTAASIVTALQLGADIVELDVVESTDGDWFLFHNGYERAKFGRDLDIRALSTTELESLRYLETDHDGASPGPERLDTVLERFGDTLLNIDRSWPYWPGLLDHLASFDRAETLLLKAPVTDDLLDQLEAAPVAFPFSPIVRHREEFERVWRREAINTVAVELIAEHPDDPLVDAEWIAGLRERGLMLYLNALNLGNGHPLFCGWDDETSLLVDPDQGWGRLVALGADIIQTDWPIQLRRHLTGRPLGG